MERSSVLRSSLSSSLASTSDIRRLTSDIRSPILRGVRADVALASFGQIFKTGGIGNFIQDEYNLSEEVDDLDDFISHDWCTGRVHKFLILCLIFNLRAAVVASLLVGALLSQVPLELFCSFSTKDAATKLVAGGAYRITASVRCLIGCGIAFTYVLFCWQRIRSILGLRVRRLFVDKVCIHQTNEVVKAEGILGLAGFLKRSHRLVVLWTPRYFTRLWCTYEIASWLHLGKDLKGSMKFVNINCSDFIIMTTLAVWLFCYVKVVVWFDPSNHNALTDDAISFNHQFLAMVCSVLVFFLFRADLIRESHKIRSHLTNFSIRKCKCFCCQHHHIHPETHEALPCDRKLVYKTLRRWSPSFALKGDAQTDQEHTNGIDDEVSPDDSSHLNVFDELVQTQFAANLGHQCSYLSYTSTLMMGLPLVWQMMDTAANLSSIDDGKPLRFQVGLRVVGFAVIQWLAILPCFYFLMITVTDGVAHLHSRTRVALVGAHAVLFFAVWLVSVALNHCLLLERWEPQFLLSLALLALTIWVFQKDYAYSAQGQWSTGGSKETQASSSPIAKSNSDVVGTEMPTRSQLSA